MDAFHPSCAPSFSREQAPVHAPEALTKMLMDLVCKLPHCEKGLCMTPATRTASRYTSEKIRAWEGPCCDVHGSEPAKEYDYAEELRRVCAVLRASGVELWWDSYSGALNAPKQKPVPAPGATDVWTPPGVPHVHGGTSVCWCNMPGFGTPLTPGAPA
jgi:hypothetical protein